MVSKKVQKKKKLHLLKKATQESKSHILLARQLHFLTLFFLFTTGIQEGTYSMLVML